MKLGVHMSMFCKNWTDDTTISLKHVKKIGYDGVEISLFGVEKQSLYHAFDVAHQLGLVVSCGTGLTPTTDISSPDAQVRENGIIYLKEAIDIAHKANARFINGVLYAPWQKFMPRQSKNERWSRSAQCLQTVGEYARQADISLNCEVLNRFETDFFNTLEEGSRFIKLIGLDNIRLLADTFHMNIEEDNLPKAVSDHFASIGCIHVCENHRGVPGTGHIPWEELMAILRQKNYNGFLTVESFVETSSAVADAMFTWRNIGSSALAEAEKGFHFLSKMRK